MDPPLRLRLDGDALTANWRWLAMRSGAAACGAAVKADGYGLGAQAVVERLSKAGCRDFFVATWAEHKGIIPTVAGLSMSVLHGVRADDMPYAVRTHARPVLNTPEQILRWRPTRRPCDVMIDTGMSRLGLSVQEVSEGLLDGLEIDTLMSHLACADEDSPMNAAQLATFKRLTVPAKRRSLANSAGICLGNDYAFNLTRPGLGLYGGVPRSEAAGHINQVAFPEAQVVQVRRVRAGDSVGYGATFVATEETKVAILNIGYADGYLRGFSGVGTFAQGSFSLLGRVSMDLVAIDVTASDVNEGDWIGVDYELPSASAACRLSQYELLTGLGSRFDRIWT